MKVPQHVRTQSGIFLYQLKAPFTTSGKSVLGALEYDKENDLLKCHECGEWVVAVGQHVHVKHAPMTARQYRRKHGLKVRTSLNAEGLRAHLSYIAVKQNRVAKLNTPSKIAGRIANLVHMRGRRLSAAEARNERGHCPAQIIQKLQRLRDALGRTPTHREIIENRISIDSVKYVFGSFKKAIELAGLKYREPNARKGFGRKYSTEQLLEMLRIFVRINGRLPRSSDFGRILLPDRGTYIGRFGSLAKAWIKAGLPLTRKMRERRVPYVKAGRRASTTA